MTILGFPEREVWKLTPYKIMALFRIHKTFNSDKFGQEKEIPEEQDPIDIALGGL